MNFETAIFSMRTVSKPKCSLRNMVPGWEALL